MTDLLQQRALKLLLWLLPAAIVAAWLVFSLRVVTDMSQFLPAGASAEQVMLMDELRAGDASRTLLIGLALDGGPRQALAAASDYLAAELAASGDFVFVHNGRRSIHPDQHPFLYRYRFLLSPVAVDASGPALQQALERQLEIMMSSMVQGLAGDPRQDPLLAWQAWLQSIQPGSGPRLAHGVWFSDDGEQALLLARSRAPAFAIGTQQQLLDDIRATLARNSNYGTVIMDISGPAVFAVQSRDIIAREATLLSLGGTLLVIMMLWLVLRRLSLVLLAALPLLTGILAAVAIVNLVFGSIHGITLAFGITVIGVAVDYPLHLFIHKQAGVAATATMRRIWPVLRLGLITTVTGYLAMLFSGFTGLAQLGLFAITGLATAVLISRYLLPQLMAEGWQVQGRLFFPKPGKRRGVAMLLWLLCVIAVGIIVATEDPWQRDIAALNPRLDAQKALDDELRAELGAADTRHFVLLSAGDQEQVLQESEALMPVLDRLVARRVIDGYDIVSRYLPSARTQLLRRAALPVPELLRDRLHQAQQGLPFTGDSFEPFVQAIRDSQNLPPLRPDNLAGTLLEDIVRGLLFERAGSWYALVPLTGIHDYRTLEAVIGAEGDVVFDLKGESSRLLDAYRDRALLLLALGAVIIALVLAVGLRSPLQALRVFVPVAAALLVTVAILILAGERLSLFHLASLLLVTGIALDYSLFFHAPVAAEGQHRRSLQAISLCALTTLLVFGLLALANTPVLHAIGLTVVSGTLAALVYTLFSVAPAGPKKP